MPSKLFKIVLSASFVGATLFGCRMDMHDGPRFEPYEASDFFGDGLSARQPVEGTVARGLLKEDRYFHTGKQESGGYGDTLPFKMSAEDLDRGQERYKIFCSPCHGQVGNGMGMVVQRGLKQPPSFHEKRLREMPLGYFFDTITNGFGVMYDYKARVKVRDRWLISAYVRTLQLSQYADFSSLDTEDQKKLKALR